MRSHGVCPMYALTYLVHNCLIMRLSFDLKFTLSYPSLMEERTNPFDQPVEPYRTTSVTLRSRPTRPILRP